MFDICMYILYGLRRAKWCPDAQWEQAGGSQGTPALRRSCLLVLKRTILLQPWQPGASSLPNPGGLPELRKVTAHPLPGAAASQQASLKAEDPPILRAWEQGGPLHPKVT